MLFLNFALSYFLGEICQMFSTSIQVLSFFVWSYDKRNHINQCIFSMEIGKFEVSILWWIIFFFLFAEPIRRSSSTSRNLLNPPQSLDFYGRRPPSVTSDMSQEKSFTATTASVNLNVLPLISKTKMVHASKKAFLQVLIN